MVGVRIVVRSIFCLGLNAHPKPSKKRLAVYNGVMYMLRFLFSFRLKMTTVLWKAQLRPP